MKQKKDIVTYIVKALHKFSNLPFIPPFHALTFSSLSECDSLDVEKRYFLHYPLDFMKQETSVFPGHFSLLNNYMSLKIF